MTLDLNNEYVQSLIKAYRKALKIYYEACEDSLKLVEETTDYSIVIEMMNDAIQYKDQQMKARILYEKYNDSKKEAHQH